MQMREARAVADRRQASAEAEAEAARIAAARAMDARDAAVVRLGATQNALDEALTEIQRLRADVSLKDVQLSELDSSITDMHRREDAAVAQAAKATHHKEAAI